MLLEIEEALLRELSTNNIKAEGWSGKPEDLFTKPRTYPAIRLVIEGANLEEMHAPYAYIAQVNLSFLVFFRSLREQGQGAYPFIENLIRVISGKTFAGFDIRAKGITLLYSEAGEFAYELKCIGYGRFVVDYEDREPLVRRITTYQGQELETDVKSIYWEETP
jgi:hypothetical protein